jgi:hypothetical protein
MRQYFSGSWPNGNRLLPLYACLAVCFAFIIGSTAFHDRVWARPVLVLSLLAIVLCLVNSRTVTVSIDKKSIVRVPGRYRPMSYRFRKKLAPFDRSGEPVYSMRGNDDALLIDFYAYVQFHARHVKRIHVVDTNKEKQQLIRQMDKTDHDIFTYVNNTDKTVCVELLKPLKDISYYGGYQHPDIHFKELYISVNNPQAFVEAVQKSKKKSLKR